MIGLLRGQIAKIYENHLILDVNNVGYLVYTSQSFLNNKNLTDNIVLFIETVVREDAITLFGFETEIEKDLFNLLTTVKGVGSKVALSILSSFEPATVTNIIITEDTNALSSISGIGPKLAARIVNELKDKKSLANIEVSKFANSTSSKQISKNNLVNDAVSALTNLGYSRNEALSAINKISVDTDFTINKIITEALKELSV
jgi:Holliday junction DNA helicase RuvA